MKILGYLIVIILCIAFAVIGLFNNGAVTLDYIWDKQTLPLVVVMLICFLFGALMMLVLFGAQTFFWRQRARALEHLMARERKEAEKAAIQAEFHADRETAA